MYMREYMYMCICVCLINNYILYYHMFIKILICSYQKFIRGKDLNTYKSKDLANIFGRKELTDKRTNVEKDNSTCEKKTIENDTKDCTHGVVTINKGNMADYFKSKLNSNYNKNLANHITNNRAIGSENEQIGFGFVPKTENTLSIECRISKDSESNYAFDNPCLGLNSPVNFVPDTNGIHDTEKPEEKRNKEFGNVNLHFKEVDGHNKRKKLKTEISDSDCKNAFINPALNLDTESKENCNRNQFEVSRAEFGLENCGLDLTDENTDKKRVTFNDHIMLYEYNIDSFKKKKKGQATLDKFEVKNKKNKRKRKRENMTSLSENYFINKALDVEILCDEMNDNELNEHRSKKNKKRKICKMSSLETIEESPEQEKEIINIETKTEVVILENEKTNMDQKSKKKKKKIKDIKIIELDIENEESDIKNEEVKKDKSKEVEIIIPKKCKKKKKKDKENCETELKDIVQTEIDNDKQNSNMLEKSSISHLVGIENKNAIEIEILPVIAFEAQEDIKEKKKKDIDKENQLKNEISIYDVEKEISSKGNADKVQDTVMKKLMKKDKKHKKSKDMNIFDIGNSCHIEIADESIKRK